MVAMPDDIAKHLIFYVTAVLSDRLDHVKAIQSCSLEAFLLLNFRLLKNHRGKYLALHR